MEILSDLLRQFFSENLTIEQKVDLLRDENLSLKSKLFHTLCGISDEELLLSSEEEEDERAIRVGRKRNGHHWRVKNQKVSDKFLQYYDPFDEFRPQNASSFLGIAYCIRKIEI